MKLSQATVFRSQGATDIVTLSQPPANAMSSTTIEALDEAVTSFENSNARVLVIESDVPGTFVAGADIKEMKKIGATGFREYGKALRELFNRIENLSKPVIAAIDGLALGGGMELALACHLRVGGADAVLGLPEPKLGLIPGAGGTQRLPRAIGKSRALDILLTGRTLHAKEAYEYGILNVLTESGGATDAAVEMAEKIARLSPSSLAEILRIVDIAIDQDLSTGLAAETEAVERLFLYGDVEEGLTAFLEKRTPDFA